MATTVSELQVVVSADTSKAESGLSSFSSKLGSVGSTMATAFGAAAIGGIVAVGAAATSSVMKFAEFQTQINILKVTTQATDEQMASMAAQARALGSDMDLPATSSAGAAIAMLELAKAGLSVEQTQMAAKGALQLAAAAGIDEAKAAQLTAGALNAFGLEGSRATSIANQLAYAANASSLDATDLGQAVAQAGFIFKATGQPVESLIAAMIELGNAGLSGSDGATAIKNALMQATNPTDQAKKAMNQYGISLFDAKGQMKDVPAIVDHLNDRLGPLTEQQRNAALATIFQGDGMKALIPLMAAGGEKLREHEANLKTTNAASEQAQARAQGLEGAWKGLVSQWKTAQEALGSKLAPAIEALIRSSAEGIGSITPLLESVGEQVGNALVSGIETAKDLLRQLSDAWGTVKQVFGEGWAPDASIEPLALAAGNAATKLRELSEWAGRVVDAMRNNGALETFGRALETIRTEADLVGSQLSKLAGIGIDANDSMSGAAAAGKLLATGLELTALAVGQVADTMLSFVGLAVNFISVFGQIGRAVAALASGDMAAFDTAMVNAATAVGNFSTIGQGHMDRMAERATQAFRSVAGAAETEMPAMTEAVSAEMAEASAAAAAGMAELSTAVGSGSAEAAALMDGNMALTAAAAADGMAQAVGAVEAAGPPFGAAAAAMGQAATAGLEAEAAMMEAAAAAGATGAVAAVQGQTGAAHAAGTSVGQNLGDGMQGGILSRIGAVISAARQMVAAALGAGNAEGEIESPSKKTMYMGQMLDEGLIKGIESLEPDVKRAMQDLIQGVTDYAPVAREVARVEREIKDIRERSQTDALFRAEDMITVESELLRLKKDQVEEERRLLPIRRDLADAEREVSRISNGSLADRSALLDNDAERKGIRLQTLELEKQLVGLDRDSKRAEGIQKQIDKLRDQDRLLGIEADKIRLTNDIAATAERRRVLGLGEILASEEKNLDAIGRQITALGAEEAVFRANEAIIKNATDNEIGYRQRLIAVFNAEGKPLADRITAGLALVDQLEAEGSISKELADKLRAIGKEAGVSAEASKGLGTAAQTAAPQLDAAAQKAKEMADQAKRIAEQANKADGEVSALAKSLGKLPSWFTPTGSKSSKSVLFGPSSNDSAGGSRDSASIVPLIDGGGSSGGTQTHVFQVSGPDGRTLAEWHVRGKEMAVEFGLASRGSA